MASQPSPSDSPKHQDTRHLHSCAVCRQRKVKCDKLQRCSNCVKAGIECVYALPARTSRRTNGKPSEDALLLRLRRYEEIFKKHGLEFEDRDPGEGDGRISKPKSLGSTANDAMVVDRVARAGQAPQQSTLQSTIWKDLSNEILQRFRPSDSSVGSVLDSNSRSEAVDSLTLSFTFDSGSESLTKLHPSTVQIFRLWQKFLDNVNPLIKIIHVPTVQRELLEASVNLEEVSKPFEALMFAIYASAITSISDEECMKLTSTPKGQLRQNYHRAAQQALTRAGFLGTLDVVVLQAALLLLISMRPEYDPGEFWVLIGIVLRIAQRIGIHLKSYPANLSIVEVQTRRRLWWQIIILDARCAQRCGTNAFPNPEQWDVPLPLNVNDSDLTPNMIVAPRDHLGATEMTFCLVMYEIAIFLRRSAAIIYFGASLLESLPNKDKVLDELDETLERKVLRYCDPVIPLHILTGSVARIVCGKLRFTLCHPRQFQDGGTSMGAKEKDKLFETCLIMIERDNILHSTESIRGFKWRMDHQFQVDAFVYLLSELRFRPSGTLADKAWPEISETFLHRPNMISDVENPLFVGIGNLTLKSWEVRDQQLRRQYPNSKLPSPPYFIKQLEARRTNITSFSAEALRGSSTTGFDAYPSRSQAAEANGVLVPSEISDPMLMNIDPIDWNYWSDLIHDAGVYPIDNGPPQASQWPA